MEEREALKRQIELLQNLINKHKSIHGDTPLAGPEQRHPETSTSARDRGQCASDVHPHSTRGRPYAPQSQGSWRKTYSLSNKGPQASAGHPSDSTFSSVHQHVTPSSSSSSSSSLPSQSKSATSSSLIPQSKDEAITGVRETEAAVSQHEDKKQGTTSQHESLHKQTREIQQKAESRQIVLPGKMVSGSSEFPSLVKGNRSTSLQIKPFLTSKSSTETKQTTPAVLAPGNRTSASALPVDSTQASSQSSQAQVSASYLKKSKFTWVKSQSVGGVESKQASCVPFPEAKVVTSTAVSKASATGSPSSYAGTKRSSAKKLPRKLSLVAVSPKTSKYKWVSSAGAQVKTSRKPPSPKTLAQRAQEKSDAAKKLKTASTPPAKLKKGLAGSSAGSVISSRYRWKAGGQSAAVTVTGGLAVARRRSAFHWTAEKSSRGSKGGLAVSPGFTQRASLSSVSPSGFKLRSRMKIVRKSPNSGAGSEKGSSLSAVRYSPRGRMLTSTRSPTGVRRTPSRELVSFGRHKLRRLSPTSSRTNPTSTSFSRSPASQRVFRTRYKMVTRPGSGATHTIHYNPALSWRAKRIQTARSFLQNRLRAPHDRHPSSTQHWRGSSMCWIRGSLYRVSANKLSRTVAANMSINRTGRFSTHHPSHMSPASTRPSSTRHLASRAVQRSLAIIRQKQQQKKQQKQYCMYYNRFGKCNRGMSCPYIHDPDKVAVCTRFLRGTCKPANGTCPFSHKVAKEKMPVCSYFLKGICNNSDCPYSHVYVSRKAEVCEDFVKGYCPEGEKCKKKHTLVCPDFSKTGSCPRGSRCKLQHRQRAKRSAGGTSSVTPAKKVRTKEPPRRPRLSLIMPQDSQAAPGTAAAGPLELPSFISLSSSPEDADAPDTLPADTSQVKEKKLQIKPRL
ncbi:zinc finger CCCH domain-containing protein 3 [Parambassis ranga]|uniref:Zinc finger CCCH domain-containing protein 3 n=1 Tax=Parambassis ranga TaxID=210632 RepID=A0A6P7I5P6_9TELE|nr:zinc finger CCCH domain-containing protein 3 [Parambassis ranga]